MPPLIRSQNPFQFYTRVHLLEFTGRKASNIMEFLQLIKDVPGSSIYHHTHRFLQQHQHLSPEPPNDFSYWVTQALGEHKLGENLASIDIIQYSTIRDLRNRMIEVIEEYIGETPSVKLRFAQAGQEFYFIKSHSFVLPTHHIVYDLKEFLEVLKKVTIDSIYFHIFEARLRLEKKTNDFSSWIETSLGDPQLAYQIATLDPYTHTLEDLRRIIMALVAKRILPL